MVNAKDNTIEAGNGTYQAAKIILGWENIAAVHVEDGPRRELRRIRGHVEHRFRDVFRATVAGE